VQCPSLFEQDPLFGGGDVVPGSLERIRIHRDRVDSQANQTLGVVRVDGGCLPADGAGEPKAPAAGDDRFDGAQHRRISFVVEGREDLAVAIDAEDELRQIVRSDRHASDAKRRTRQEPVHDRRDFGHDPPFQPRIVAERTVVDQSQARGELAPRSHEGDHQLEVVELRPHLLQDAQLEGEQLGLLCVPETPAVPDHRILFLGLVLIATGEPAKLVGPKGLAALNAIACAHHEKSDGSGYHKRVRADAVDPSAALLAATEVYVGMTTERADRPAFSAGDAGTELRRLASTDVLEPRAIRAVLVAAGQGEPTAPAVRRAKNPGGLSRREVDVLRLAARGLTTREIGERLYISTKTADHHIQHVYTKIGVSTRAAAALWAMQNAVVS
jgi:DNA-binding CsgD family transcriptional regulator